MSPEVKTIASHLYSVLNRIPKDNHRLLAVGLWSQKDNCGCVLGWIQRIYCPPPLPPKKHPEDKVDPELEEAQKMRDPLTFDGCHITTVIIRLLRDAGISTDSLEAREFINELVWKNDRFVGTPEERYDHVMGFLGSVT